MTARILVVDDIEANVRLLEAKLSAEYYEVIPAYDGGLTALELAAKEQPDIILLDVMMPGMDGFEVCRRLKEAVDTRHIPVVLVTALDGRSERVAGLDSGADEFLTKPVEDIFLFARVRALTRLKLVIDELRQREESGRRLGVIEAAGMQLGGTGGRVLVVDDNERQAQRIAGELAIDHRPVLETEELDKAQLSVRGPVDLVILNIAARGFDGLRFAAHVRSDEATRHLPILAIVDIDDRARVVKALDLGVSDILPRPVDPQELSARARTQIKRKRYTDFLRNNLDRSLELAVTDTLTGLHNRRYMMGQLKALADRAVKGGRTGFGAAGWTSTTSRASTTVFGHPGGDEVLRESRGPSRHQCSRHRSRLPLGRGGVRRGHARNQGRGRPAHRRTHPYARRGLAVPHRSG